MERAAAKLSRALAAAGARAAREPPRPPAPGPGAPAAAWSAWAPGPGAPAPPWGEEAEEKEPPSGAIRTTTSRGPVEFLLRGLEHLTPAQRAGLETLRPIEIHRHTLLAGALTLVPPDAPVAAFICVEPLTAAEWAERAWQLRTESLRQKPGRALFFCPDCPFQRLPRAEDAPRN